MPKADAILVVEDDPVLRLLLVEELEQAGYEVFAGQNAQEAINVLENNPDIRLMLTDIDLVTEAEGLQLAKQKPSACQRCFSETVASVAASWKSAEVARSHAPSSALRAV